MTSRVFAALIGGKAEHSQPERVRRLVRRAGLAEVVGAREMVAIKVHWGERENTAHLRPVFVRAVVEAVRKAGGRPFVTDTNVLYRGHRHDALANLETAQIQGFTQATLDAPLLVADGLNGRDAVDVPIPGGRRLKSTKVASAIHAADALVVLSHVKGHLLFGFGGALKNLGMGCTTPAGKQVLHSDVHPTVDESRCIGCTRCGLVCPVEAITFPERPPGWAGRGKVVAHIDGPVCLGCGECPAVCPEEAIPIQWETAQAPLMEKTAEAASATVTNKAGKVLYVNFLVDVVPDCDCFSLTRAPVVPDLGFLASTDPVAVDQASVDLINAAVPCAGSLLAGKPGSGDHVRDLFDRDYTGLLAHAELLGMGTRRYELVRI
jgi:uncharacterized Fe-S center protein